MKVRIRHHVNPLRLDFQRPRGEHLVCPPGREVEVEVGCAEGQFLFARARHQPTSSILTVGLEIRRELVQAINAEAKSIGLGERLGAVFCNANVDLAALFAPETVARFFVNFPDPWFKRRQHKRRMVTDQLVVDMHTALMPGGEILFQSDVFEVALDALETFEAREELLVNAAGAWSFWKTDNPYGVRSRREEYCTQTNMPVWRILYRKAGEGANRGTASAASARAIAAP